MEKRIWLIRLSGSTASLPSLLAQTTAPRWKTQGSPGRKLGRRLCSWCRKPTPTRFESLK